ncbi:NUDIX hydrolase [Edaphobacter paludis]|uniref:GDP-mannose pyrophosphatase n=1 Tax=Edaphobacter paludis TaxID=3035702 RepID=A0AAU7D4T7_9BACT
MATSTKRPVAPKSKSASKSPASKPKTTAKKKPSATKAALISSKLSYKGTVFSVYTDQVMEPRSTTVHTRDVIRHNGSIVVLAVDESVNPKDPDLILIRQYRHAAGQFLLELPAGRIEPKEAPLAAAKREMIEETGFRAKRWTSLTKYYASPGFLGESMQIYLARDLSHGASNPEDDEHIEIVRTPLSKALALIAANKIHDGKTLIGVSLYAAARREGRL